MSKPSLFEAAPRDAIVARIGKLTPENPRRWGTFSHQQVVCHMADALRMAMGEITTAPPKGPAANAVMRYLVIHVLPWPKGKAKGPPESFTTGPGDWEADRKTLVDLVRRFGETSPTDLAPTNPIFGKMKPEDWAVLQYRHLNHHLTQFGA